MKFKQLKHRIKGTGLNYDEAVDLVVYNHLNPDSDRTEELELDLSEEEFKYIQKVAKALSVSTDTFINFCLYKSLNKKVKSEY